MKIIPTMAVAGAALVFSGCASAKPLEIKRTFAPNGAIPIASVVHVPAGADLVFISGMLPSPVISASVNTPPSYAPDTKTQALDVLAKLKAALAGEGLTFADVTTVRVFLVGDPKLGGKMDFAGFNEAFRTEFGNDANPNRPTRTVVQVVALPAPAMVEVDLIAAKLPKPK
jgi:enamine deaminase RidA (YjgF/YER057c/UK114 family)